MRKVFFDVDERSGRTELRVHCDTSDTDAINARECLRIGKGFTAGRTMRAVSEIPVAFLDSLVQSGDVDANGYVLSEDPTERRKSHRRLLARFPEFRISEGGL
jgi:hypothetical protein